MAKYIIKKTLIAIMTILVLVTIVFILVRLLPGDPFADDKIPLAVKERIKEYYGLDKPIHIQYATYMKNLLKGNFGYSLKFRNRTVNQIIADAFPYSIDLGIRAVIFAIIVGILLGIIAALKHNETWDYVSMIIAIIGVSIPSFIIGSVIQYFLGVKFKLLPVAQWKNFQATIMPTFALGLGTLAQIARLMRASMLEITNTDYIKMAQSKGLSDAKVTINHEIRNSILPVVTILGPTIAELLTGSFVIENIFAIPGLGKHFVDSIRNLDYALVLGLTIVFGIFLVSMQLVVDILYGIIDPRINSN